MKGLAQALLAVLLPPRCGICRQPLATWPALGLCQPCLETLVRNDGPRCERCDHPGASGLCGRCRLSPPPFLRIVSPYLYGGVLADLITQAKFEPREELAVAAGRLLAEQSAVRTALASVRALVPVPLGARRRRSRGFNQSAVMARIVGRALGLPVLYALRRTRETAAQSDLPLTSRRANVAGAFRARKPLSGRYALIDDVVTSTETVRQASVALLEAGAEEVTVVALSRTELGAGQPSSSPVGLF